MSNSDQKKVKSLTVSSFKATVEGVQDTFSYKKEKLDRTAVMFATLLDTSFPIIDKTIENSSQSIEHMRKNIKIAQKLFQKITNQRFN